MSCLVDNFGHWLPLSTMRAIRANIWQRLRHRLGNRSMYHICYNEFHSEGVARVYRGSVRLQRDEELFRGLPAGLRVSHDRAVKVRLYFFVKCIEESVHFMSYDSGVPWRATVKPLDIPCYADSN